MGTGVRVDVGRGRIRGRSAGPEEEAVFLEMGAVQSDSSAGVDETDAGNKYVLISNESEASLRYDPSQSHFIAFSINRQTSPRFQHRQLNDTVVYDAFKVMSALREKGALPREHAKLLEANIEPDSCTFAGMKKAFQDQAQRVGRGGIFFFHFSGHGIRVGNNQFGLAPVDFDYTSSAYITGDVLNQWLKEADCQARYVLFTIDCCYAGGLAEALTRGSDTLAPYPGLYVMAACTANEVSVIIGTLGNSVFCYFLSHAILTTDFSPGNFPVGSIYDKCKKLSIALSSLLLSYDKTAGVEWKTMQPELAHSTLTQTVLEMSGEGEEQTDANIMRFSYATELYNYTGSGGVIPLERKCQDWLEMTYMDDNGGLSQLKEEGVLGSEQCVMDTVLCCMLRSVASIQRACDPTTVASPNLYITAYMHVVAAIDIVQCGRVDYREREFALGLAYYLDTLSSNDVNTQELQQLFDRLLGNLKAKMARVEMTPRGDDMTDSGESVSGILHRLPGPFCCKSFNIGCLIFASMCT